jgi:predicted SAM-dependent methyltransferase
MELPTEPLRLNLAAGAMVLPGWRSVGLDDAHDIRADIRSLPLADAVADEVMCIHGLEHLWRWEADAALREWWRVLKPGGRLVLEQPELFRCCQMVLTNPDPRRGLWGLFGDPGYKDELMAHKWCWAKPELIQALRDAGFVKVKTDTPQFHARRAYRDLRYEAIK